MWLFIAAILIIWLTKMVFGDTTILELLVIYFLVGLPFCIFSLCRFCDIFERGDNLSWAETTAFK